jgi:hypothetical protein
VRAACAGEDRNAGGSAPPGPSSALAGRTRSPIGTGKHDPDGSDDKETDMLTLLRGRTFRTIDAAVLFLLAVIAGTSVAYAFQAPAAGDLGYDIYDIVVNQGVKGPLGFVGGVAAFLFGVSRLFSNIMIGIPTIVAAVCLIKADSILQTFGMLI